MPCFTTNPINGILSLSIPPCVYAFIPEGILRPWTVISPVIWTSHQNLEEKVETVINGTKEMLPLHRLRPIVWVTLCKCFSYKVDGFDFLLRASLIGLVGRLSGRMVNQQLIHSVMYLVLQYITSCLSPPYIYDNSIHSLINKK